MKIAIGLVMLAVVGGIVAFLLRDTMEPRERAVQNAFEAIVERDVEVLYALMSDAEKAHVEKAAFEKYLNEYVLQGIAGLRRVGEPSVSSLSDGSEFYSTTQDFSGGLRVSFNSRLFGDDTRVDSMVHTLFFARMNYELGNVPLPPTRECIRHLVERLRGEEAELKAIGIEGFYLGGSEPQGYVTIEEYAASREAALEGSR